MQNRVLKISHFNFFNLKRLCNIRRIYGGKEGYFLITKQIND